MPQAIGYTTGRGNSIGPRPRIGRTFHHRPFPSQRLFWVTAALLRSLPSKSVNCWEMSRNLTVCTEPLFSYVLSATLAVDSHWRPSFGRTETCGFVAGQTVAPALRRNVGLSSSGWKEHPMTHLSRSSLGNSWTVRAVGEISPL